MASTNFYLKESNSKFETPINVLFHFDGNRFKLSTGEKIAPKFWNFKAKRVKKSFPGSPEFNTKLDYIEGELQAIYRLSVSNKTPLTKESIRTEMMKRLSRSEEKKKDLLEYFDEFIEIRKATDKPNTIKKFKSCRNLLRHFGQVKKIKISFENIDTKFYEQLIAFSMMYEGSYVYFDKERNKEVKLRKGKHLNSSVTKSITILKQFLHWATDRQYNSNTAFKKFKIFKTETDIIYLSEKELMSLYSHDFKDNVRLSQVRDVFCFGCFSGLRYGDTAQLRKENVKGEEIHFKTEKTKDNLIVPLNDFAKEILKKYDFQLPTISNQKTNQYLKEMGKAAGINDTIVISKYRGAEEIQMKEPKYHFLSSHTMRRTFVTLSLEKGMRAETVMAITGHKDYRSFKKYIKLTSKVKLVEMKQVWNKKPDHMKVV